MQTTVSVTFYLAGKPERALHERRPEIYVRRLETIGRIWVTIFVTTFPGTCMNIASNVEWGVESMEVSTFVVYVLSVVLFQMYYRLTFRFFLNLQAILYYGQTTAKSQTAVSTMPSPTPSGDDRVS